MKKSPGNRGFSLLRGSAGDARPAYDDGEPVHRDFLWEQGKVTALEPAFKEGNRAAALNERDEIVGSAWISARRSQHAVLWTLKR
jgi:hypothetical protein